MPSDEQYEELSREGMWYFSPYIPQETETVAQQMHAAGESPRNIGRFVAGNLVENDAIYWDLQTMLLSDKRVDMIEEQVRLFCLKNTGISGVHGVLAVVPGEYYVVEDGFDFEVRFYGVYDDSRTLELVHRELERLGIWDADVMVRETFAPTTVTSSHYFENVEGDIYARS